MVQGMGARYPMTCRHKDEAEVYMQPIRNPALERGMWSAPRSGCFTPGKTWYPSYRTLGGPRGPVCTARKMSPPLRFDPRTVQPVQSRYTNWAIRAWYNSPGKVLHHSSEWTFEHCPLSLDKNHDMVKAASESVFGWNGEKGERTVAGPVSMCIMSFATYRCLQ
jgi:hypothetical protein